MKLQLILVLLGLTYVLSAPTDPSPTESNNSDLSSGRPKKRPCLFGINCDQTSDRINELTEKEFWIKIKERLEETKTKGLEIDSFITEKYNDFQDLDEYITGANQDSKNYFKDVLVGQFKEIHEKTIPLLEELKSANELVEAKSKSRKSSDNKYSITNLLPFAMADLVNPFYLNIWSLLGKMQAAFTLDNDEYIKEVAAEIKHYFRYSSVDYENEPDEFDDKPYSIFIGTINHMLDSINDFIDGTK